MASKTKSSLTESTANTPKKVTSVAPPRISKLSRGGVAKSEPNSPSPIANPRSSAVERSSPRSANSKLLSTDHSSSPLSANSKPSTDRRSPKVPTPPEKPQSRLAKGLELQTQLSQVQEDLKKANDQIASLEKDKGKVQDELKEAQKAVEETNEKLREALVAQKRAEENSEVEKFRAIELEQAEIESAHKKEKELENELKTVRKQQELDLAELRSIKEELEKVNQELEITTDAKNKALTIADDATNTSEIHAGKVEILSSELSQLKALLNSKHEIEDIKSNETVSKLKLEIDYLKQELGKSRNLEEKLLEREASIEQLNVDLEAAKMAESYAHNLAAEWKKRVEETEMQVNTRNKLERSASESLESVMKQLEESNDLVHNAESEISALKEKVGLLQMTTGRQREDLEKAERNVHIAKEDMSKMGKVVELLQIELETAKEEKMQALNNEKLAASSIQSLLEEKNGLINELESSKEEEEKSKKAMESLASALHEVSAEAREAKERLLSGQTEYELYETQIEDLKLVMKATNEKYEHMLDEAKDTIDLLEDSIEKSKEDFRDSRSVWEQKEHHLMSRVEKSEEEISSMEKEINRLVNLLKQSGDKVHSAKEEEARLVESLKEVEAEVILLQETLVEAKGESMKLKESLLDKETELQSVILENEELREKEAASLKNIEELSVLLDKAIASKQNEEISELTDSEKDYDLLPRVVEFSEENGHRSLEEKPRMSFNTYLSEEPLIESFLPREVDNHLIEDHKDAKIENGVAKPKENENKEKDESVENEFKMWESCQIEKKEASPEREPEHKSIAEELDIKVNGVDNFDQVNESALSKSIEDGRSSPTQQQEPQEAQEHKKKKPLFRKFGNLLKKKSPGGNVR